jgi:hypothetical protein
MRRKLLASITGQSPATHQILEPALLLSREKSVWSVVLNNYQRSTLIWGQLSSQRIQGSAG